MLHDLVYSSLARSKHRSIAAHSLAIPVTSNLHQIHSSSPRSGFKLGNPPLRLRHLAQQDLKVLLFVLELQPLVGIQLSEDVVALAVELQDPGVVLPQTPAMADSHEGNAQLLGRIVHDLLRLERDAARALVENGVLGLVVEEPGHGHALLKAARKDVPPLRLGVPALVVQVGEMLQPKDGKDLEKVGVGDANGRAPGGESRGM